MPLKFRKYVGKYSVIYQVIHACTSGRGMNAGHRKNSHEDWINSFYSAVFNSEHCEL